MENLTDIINGFDISAEVNDIQPLGKGLINDTYLVKTEGDAPDYVLQRINDSIFKNPELLQRNIDAVTGTSGKNSKPQERMTLTVKC